jgi:stage IV sporulation protein FB
MTIGKTKIHAGFVLLICALVYLDQGGLLVMAAIAAALHELGHYIPLRLMGGRVALLEFHGGGIDMSSVQPMGYTRELLTVLGGPFASLAFALIFSLNDGMINGQMPIAGMLLSHGLFNLLPVRGLDGGRALALGLDALGFTRTQTVLSVTTTVICAFLAVLCGYTALKTRNLSLFFAMIYLLTRR